MTAATIKQRTSATLSRPPVPAHRIVDKQISSWASIRSDERVSRQKLLTYTQKRIVSLTKLPFGWDGAEAKPVNKDYAHWAIDLVSVIVAVDEQATPQVSPTVDGGIEVEWLVSGNHLGFSIGDEAFCIWGELDGGRDAFRPFEAEPQAFTNPLVAAEFQRAAETAREFLQYISIGVTHRLSIQ